MSSHLLDEIDIARYTKYISEYDSCAWSPGSRFDIICQKFGYWESSLPPDLHFNVDCLYALKSQPGMLCNLACLHIWFDQLHCALYRLSYPGFDESAPTAYIAKAPPEWLEKLRKGCYSRAIEVRQKIRFLAKHAMILKSGGWRISRHVYESIRNQLAYITCFYPHGQPEDLRQESHQGFEDMVAYLIECSSNIASISLPVSD